MLSALASCSNDGPQPKGELPAEVKSEGIFLSLDINFPETRSSRSQTNTEGNTGVDLPASSNENVINSVNLYFFENKTGETGNLLLALTFADNNDKPTKDASSNNIYKLVKEISLDDLKSVFGKDVNIYAIANHTPSTSYGSTTTEKVFLNDKFTQAAVGEGYLLTYSGNGMECPMASYDKFNVNLKSYSVSQNDQLGDIYSVAHELFEIIGNAIYWEVKSGGSNTINLERMVARVDYKDGSKVPDKNNIYKLSGHTSSIPECDTDDGAVYLKVGKMQLFNVGKEAYNFRHTAAGADDAAAVSSVSAFGMERGNGSGYNWIADSDWSTKNLLNKLEGVTGWPSFTTGGTTADALTGSDKSDYHAWNYLMENTVSSKSAMSDAACTGILFQVQLCKSDGSLYTSTSGGEQRITRTSDNYFKKLNKDSEGHYYLIYKYLIPHNVGLTSSSVNGESGKETNLNPMHYGVVRNNVYQLELTDINGLPNPDKPEEVSLTLNVKVKPWEYEGYVTEW